MTIQLSRRTVALTAVAIAATLAIAVTALVRTADAGGNGFSDTPPWIAAHAGWLSDNGIANGFDDGTFRPNDNLTRGQAAFWFGNYNNALELVKDSANLTSPIINGGEFRRIATCPAGKQAVAGGGETGNGFSMRTSIPVSTGWAVDWATDDGTDQVPGLTDVWALCAPDPIPE